jgi:hypothetical protein
VTTYGVFVCGYKPNDLNRIDPNLYRRAIHGFAAWLKQEKGKKDGSIVEYGIYKYWEKLFGGVILAIFEDKWDENPLCTLRDAPRNFFRLVAARWSKKNVLLSPLRFPCPSNSPYGGRFPEGAQKDVCKAGRL